MSVAYGILLSGNGGILPSGITLFGSKGWLYGRLGLHCSAVRGGYTAVWERLGLPGLPCSGAPGLRVSKQFQEGYTMRTEPPWTRRPWRGHGLLRTSLSANPCYLGNCQETLNPSASHKSRPGSPSLSLTTFSKTEGYENSSWLSVDGVCHEAMPFSKCSVLHKAEQNLYEKFRAD